MTRNLIIIATVLGSAALLGAFVLGARVGHDAFVAGLQAGQEMRATSNVEKRATEVQKVCKQGSLMSTERDLDVAIEGRGFFRVILPDGQTAYTRSGNFSFDSTGILVTDAGNPVEGHIAIDPNYDLVSISPKGMVQYTIPGNPTPQGNYQIQLSTFMNPEGLDWIGGNLFVETTKSGTPTTGNPGFGGAGVLRQDFLEDLSGGRYLLVSFASVK